ncbi:MAG: short-subunit dehydrogenase [Flavobacteriaceae bacterium]|jgi:short-subunit dehydrogenase
MKKAIIVGASSGIGKELAFILANNNFTIGVTGRREQKLLEIQQSL